MNGRGGVITFFFFLLFLFLIIVLEAISVIRGDRFCRQLSRLEDVIESVTAPWGVQDEAAELTAPDMEGAGDEGDWLVWVLRGEPKTLNPFCAEADIYTKWVTVPYIFEPLLVYDYNDLTLKLWLAESYEVSADGREISFTLRDDICFSDGHDITSDDVIFTYETAANLKVNPANAGNFFADVERAEAVSRRVVKFCLRRPYFKALAKLCLWDFGVLAKHIYEYEDGSGFCGRVSKPIGSGPFLFEKWQSGSQIVLRRNENYWGGKPRLRKIVYRLISNPAAALQALRADEVDVMIPEPDQFAEVIMDERFKERFYCLAYWTPGTPFVYIGWNLGHPISMTSGYAER